MSTLRWLIFVPCCAGWMLIFALHTILVFVWLRRRDCSPSSIPVVGTIFGLGVVYVMPPVSPRMLALLVVMVILTDLPLLLLVLSNRYWMKK